MLLHLYLSTVNKHIYSYSFEMDSYSIYLEYFIFLMPHIFTTPINSIYIPRLFEGH